MLRLGWRRLVENAQAVFREAAKIGEVSRTEAELRVEVEASLLAAARVCWIDVGDRAG